MKIIHVTDTSIYNYNGITTYINELLEVSEKRGDNAMIITTTPAGDSVREIGSTKANVKAFKCWRFPGKPKFVVVFPEGLKEIIADFNPDTIWIHTIGTLGMKVASIAKNRYKIVYTKHCFDGDLWNGYLNIPSAFHWFFNYVSQNFENRILKVSQKEIFHLSDTAKVKETKYFDKCVNIPPPLNRRFFKQECIIPKPEKKEKLVFGFGGRADPDKGIGNTFKGLKIFQQLQNNVPFQFLFIGDGPEAYRMKKKYPEMDIQITGFVDDVIPYLDRLDAFILSSLQETISLSSLEAYSRGVPVFSVPIGYLFDKKENLSNYYVFESPEELANLLYEKFFILNLHKHPNNTTKIHNSLIDYSRLYSLVTSQ